MVHDRVLVILLPMCLILMPGSCSFNVLTFYVQQEARNFANRILGIVTSFTEDALSAVSWPDLKISFKVVFQLFEIFYLSKYLIY